jgi:hypothetical protein
MGHILLVQPQIHISKQNDANVMTEMIFSHPLKKPRMGMAAFIGVE